MKKWVVAAKRADFDKIAAKYHISPMLARIIRNRDVIQDDDIRMFLNGTLQDLHSPSLMLDMESAAGIIAEEISKGIRIRIIGDYDVDGICATYILLTGLSALSADCTYQLPDRVKDGYGINRAIIDRAHADGVGLIVTCDNGIAAVSEIEYAKELGMKVVVTDHHEPPEITPPGDAVVDPKQKDCTYPYREICGAVVAYKLIQLLCQQAGHELPEDLIQFAAFATICDVMPLLNENRIIVKYGIMAMRNTNNIGLKALMDVSGCDRLKLSPFHLGFVLGPCVNATGRLDSAARALRLFTTEDAKEAAVIAQELRDLNENRKAMTLRFAETAIRIVETGNENNPPMKDSRVLVVYLPDCHESIAGIVAGRVRERFYRPTIILTKGEELVKGSGRSIEGYSMFEALTSAKDHLTKFGGHKMAAGLSMEESEIDGLRQRLNAEADLSEDDLTEKVTIDIALPLRVCSEEFTEELELLSPYGVGNSKPLFAQKDLVIREIRILGKSRNAVKLIFEGESVNGMYFTDGNAFEEEYKTGDVISMVYTPEINEYMGRRNVQAMIKEICKQTP